MGPYCAAFPWMLGQPCWLHEYGSTIKIVSCTTTLMVKFSPSGQLISRNILFSHLSVTSCDTKEFPCVRYLLFPVIRFYWK